MIGPNGEKRPSKRLDEIEQMLTWQGGRLSSFDRKLDQILEKPGR